MQLVEIEILTDDLKETENFYSREFDLEVESKSANAVSFRAGRSILTFVKSDALQPKYHFAFNIPCNKLNEAIMWASKKFKLIENPENGIVANFDTWNAKAIYFYDNNGNILEFIARNGLHNETENAFDSSSILSISEIGIVTDFPLKLADKLIDDFNLSFFEKGLKNEKFAILGDDNGLLILVKTHRNWYPTPIEAEKFFTRIKIENKGGSVMFCVNEL